MKKLSVIFILLFAVCVLAAKAPEYISSRVHGMGNAFVAVADNKNALYYNPAGLNLINRLGNFEKAPDMGYMSRNEASFRLFAVSLELPVDDMNSLLDLCGNRKDFWHSVRGIYRFDFSRFSDLDQCSELQDLFKNREQLDSIADRISSFDDETIVKLSAQLTLLEFVMHNFGFSVWANSNSISSPYINMGVFIPYFGYESVSVDMVVQTAFAFSPIENWSFGVGLKGAQRHSREGSIYHLTYNSESGNPLTTEGYQDSLENFLDKYMDIDDIIEFEDFIKFGKYSLALDFGALYQINRQVRLGASLRDVYLSKLNDESITPNFSLGAMASPMLLQSNSWFSRKVNFAIDYVDILNDNLTDMPMSHLNFGAEVEQTIVPSPTKGFSTLPRVLFGILGGAIGGFTGYLIGDNAGGTIGSLVGLGAGFLIGQDFGMGGDLIRVSGGCGFEGGYWALTGALDIPLFEIRYSSYATEMGVRTGQKENRHHMIEFSSSF